jgi:hypothetical protein
MTGPRVDVPHIPSLEEFEAHQYLTANASKAAMTPEGAKAMVPALSRIPTLEEFEQMQGMSADAVKKWKVPALPVIAPRDATSTGLDRAKDKKGTKIGGIGGEVLKQLVDPVLENPIQTAAIGAALGVPVVGQIVGGVMGGSIGLNVANYGFQKFLELHATPEQRKEMEADPERTSGEAAAVQAVMFGLAPLIHVGLKSVRGPGYGEGMFAGAGDAAASTAPKFRPGFNDAHKAADFAASLEQGAEVTATRQRYGVTAEPPKGLEAPNTSRAGAGAKPVEGLVVPETVKPGKVAAIDTVDPSAPLAENADLSNTITDGIAELRRQDAERASRIRRRPQGEKQPFFETEQGAQTLGATAARHGVDAEANPYHGESPLAASWNEGHAAATESFPEGFSMGGALADNRIPADYKVPRVPGFEPHIADVPEGVTPETIALADALKPSRFRGHSESDLIAAAVDAQERLEKAQSAQALNGEGAVGFAEHLRGDNTFADQSVGGNPFYAKTVERELIRAKSQLTQIEREAALRGLTGDELATRINDEKAARAERQAMQEDEALAAHTGDDPFAETPPSTAGGTLAPVEGTGPTRTRGLSAGVQRKALANKLDAVIGQLPEYQRLSMADQSDMAVALLEENPALARAVALGEAPAPHGLLPESVFVAVENAAIESGDVATIRELATGKLTGEATTMGQRIRALAERDPDSPVAAIQKVIDVRMGGAENVPKATAETVASLRKQLTAMKLTREQWASFVDSLKC